MMNSKEISNFFLTKFSGIIFLAFLEGSIVMFIELISARILFPYYGNTYFVWMIILSSVLSALVAGYFIGGRISRNNGKLFIYISFLLSINGLYILYLNKFKTLLLSTFYSLGLLSGAFVSSILISFIPVMIISCMTPLLIQQITIYKEQSGKFSGIVYGTSAIGGILTTLTTGFFILEKIGLSLPLIIVGVLQICLGIIILLYYKKIPLVLFFILFSIFSYEGEKLAEKSFARSVYLNEGVLGQLNVMEVFHPDEKKTKRLLLINNIPQGKVQTGFEPLSLLQYVHRISVLSSFKEKGSRVLIIGYGCGSIASEMLRLGFKVDAVELDSRLKEVASTYFYFDPKVVDFYTDDARHFIKTSKKKYDIIISDISTGEVQTSYNFTTESFGELKKILKPGGVVIINYQGYLDKLRGLAPRCIYKTLSYSGFYTWYWKYSIPEKMGDILFVASDQVIDFTKLKEERLNFCCKNQNFTKDPVSTVPIDTVDAFILTDDKPILEFLNFSAAREARVINNKDFVRNKIKVKIPLYK